MPNSRPASITLATLTALLSLLSAGASLKVNAQAVDGDRAAVLAVVTELFDGMRTKNEVMLRGVFAPEARLGKNGVDGFVDAVTSGERHLDEVTFDETILVDGDLAMAWTPYNIFIDGDFHHCGVDLFVMRRREDRWVITQLDDTRRTGGCDPTRRN